LELVTAQIQAAGAITTVEAAGQVGKRVTVAGIRQSGHRSRTAKGDPMMFLTLEDLEGTLDAVIFPDVYRRARFLLSGSAPLLYSGEVERDSSGAEALLRVEKVQRLTP
jgi:DNA polymerase-3 subunit alpha